MQLAALALSTSAVIGLAACAPQNEGVLTQGQTVHLVDGLYAFSLANCPGSNALDLVGVGIGGKGVTGFRSDPAKASSEGHTWLQAGTYTGNSGVQALGSCPGTCAREPTPFRMTSGCGWSLKLRLIRAGSP